MTADPLDPLFRRLSPVEVPWIDAVDMKAAARPGPPGWTEATAARPPAPDLWARDGTGGIRIGVRVCAPLARPATVAARLLAAAAERGVHPVILSRVPDTGLERFGFRVESVAGPTEESARTLEAEAAAFWGIDLIVDADDVWRLG